MGLQLLTIETAEEFLCLKKELPSIHLISIKDISSTYIYCYPAFGADLQVWTSATADGIGCERNWGWCPSGELSAAGTLEWNPGQPSNQGLENCGSISWSGSLSPLFNDFDCKANLGFLCEESYNFVFTVREEFNLICFRELFLNANRSVL